jgi:hypothetical protein
MSSVIPDPKHPLFNVGLRLERSQKHFEDLFREVKAFRERKPYKIETQVRAHQGLFRRQTL